MTARRKAVFLDRDGVLNRAPVRDGHPYSPRSIEELEVLPGVKTACDALREAGYLLVMVTNQPDIARGRTRLETVEEMNRALIEELMLDGAEVCIHDDHEECPCRKPKPGLLTRAAERFHIAMDSSYVVGDRWRDIEAGQRAGCRTIFIDCGYEEKRPEAPDHAASSLLRAAEWILNSNKSRGKRIVMEPAAPPTELRVKIFADGADVACITALARDSRIQGFTTNPTLMRHAGIQDYEAFARDVIDAIPDRPISFEVFSDDLDEMRRQALYISSWGPNVYVKVPVTNTQGMSTATVLRALASEGVNLNVTALMTLDHVERVATMVLGGPHAFISVFAGRIADTGRDPVPIMAAAVEALRPYPHLELIWASPREVFNVFQANSCGCHIITLTPDLLNKLQLAGKDLDEFSLDTVKMFHRDAQAAGFTLGSDMLNLFRALGDAGAVTDPSRTESYSQPLPVEIRNSKTK